MAPAARGGAPAPADLAAAAAVLCLCTCAAAVRAPGPAAGEAVRLSGPVPAPPPGALQMSQADASTGVTAAEFDRWWRQPLRAGDMNWNHMEKGFVPGDLLAPKSPTKYTRGWRHGRFLRLLNVWHKLADRLGVDYWVDAGALLGMARYAGKHLIPWDNDVDIGILDSEFQKLNATLNAAGRNGILRGGELGLPDDIIVTTRQDPSPNVSASPRNFFIPGRVVDTATGYFMDMFPFEPVNDEVLQHWWHTPWGAGRLCGDPVELRHKTAKKTCLPPCRSEYCHMHQKAFVLPTVPCQLEGAGELRCPRDAEGLLMEMYGHLSAADHRWDQKGRDFAADWSR